jgi:hypothetical protein
MRGDEGKGDGAGPLSHSVKPSACRRWRSRLCRYSRSAGLTKLNAHQSRLRHIAVCVQHRRNPSPQSTMVSDHPRWRVGGQHRIRSVRVTRCRGGPRPAQTTPLFPTPLSQLPQAPQCGRKGAAAFPCSSPSPNCLPRPERATAAKEYYCLGTHPGRQGYDQPLRQPGWSTCKDSWASIYLLPRNTSYVSTPAYHPSRPSACCATPLFP